MLLVFLFLVVAALQVLAWTLVLRPAYAVSTKGPLIEDPASTVTVIVCFRNEEANLRRCVEGILAQRFPGKFELLLVDDNSTDNSVSVVHPFTIRYDHVRLLEPGPTRPGKKDALAHGINQASYNHLLLIDADCVPASSHWLWWMTEPLRLGQEVVLGVSPLLPAKGSGWLGTWQWFESVYVSLKYLGFALRGRPYMGVGRNLAYTKSFFERVGGFEQHADLPSGDDDLLIAGNAKATTTALVTYPAAWTHSMGKTTWSAYFRQRARHQSTGVRYPKMTALHLGQLALTHGLLYLLGFILLFTAWWKAVVIVYLLRFSRVYSAFLQPMLYGHPGAGAGAEKRLMSKARLAGIVVFGDAMIGPMYLYLALSNSRKKDNW